MENESQFQFQLDGWQQEDHDFLQLSALVDESNWMPLSDLNNSGWSPQSHQISDGVFNSDGNMQNGTSQKIKLKNYTKHPLNPFFIWSAKERSKVRKLIHGKMHQSQISKFLGSQWKNMSKLEKHPYVEEAKRLRDIHLKENPEYKFTPKRKQKISTKENKSELEETMIPSNISGSDLFENQPHHIHFAVNGKSGAPVVVPQYDTSCYQQPMFQQNAAQMAQMPDQYMIGGVTVCVPSTGDAVASSFSPFAAYESYATYGSFHDVQSPSQSAISSFYGIQSPSQNSITRSYGIQSSSQSAISSPDGIQSPSQSAISSLHGIQSPLQNAISSFYGIQSSSQSAISSLHGIQSPLQNAISSFYGIQSSSQSAIIILYGTPSQSAINSIYGIQSLSQNAIGGEAVDLVPYSTNGTQSSWYPLNVEYPTAGITSSHQLPNEHCAKVDAGIDWNSFHQSFLNENVPGHDQAVPQNTGHPVQNEQISAADMIATAFSYIPIYSYLFTYGCHMKFTNLPKIEML